MDRGLSNRVEIQSERELEEKRLRWERSQGMKQEREKAKHMNIT